MAVSILEYVIKLTGGNAVVTSFTKIQKSADNAIASFSGSKWTNIAFAANQVGDAFQNAANQLTAITKAGADYDMQMRELQAITGVAGEELEKLGRFARNNAKTFGGDAAASLESYKLLISQLGPAIAQSPEALAEMGKYVSVLSKTMGGNVKAATEVVTAALNQYGVNINNPIEATAKMAEFMNIMAAAAKEGSAELPFIKAALENVGAVAKDAGVNFAETNAAIQVLDKYGKKGAEGGVALRNVLNTLAKGRFLPTEVLNELSAAGVNVGLLTDKTKSLSERLAALAPIQKDSALLSKMFGSENQLAALALVENTNMLTDLQGKIQGTNTAFEQAEIVMDGFYEKISRLRAIISDAGISVFNMTKEYLPLIQFTSEFITIGSRLAPMLSVARIFIVSTAGALKVFTLSLLTNAKTALLAGARWAFMAAFGLGSLILSLISATAAQMGLNVAMSANPIGAVIVGLLAVGAAVYAIIKNWDTVKNWLLDLGKFMLKFNPFYWLIKGIDMLFPGFIDKLKGWWNTITDWFKKLGAWFGKVWNEYIAPFFGMDKKAAFSVDAKFAGANFTSAGGGTSGNGTAGSYTGLESGIGGITGGGAKQTNFNITIAKFFDNINLYPQTVGESYGDLEEKIKDVLFRVINGVNALA